MNLWVLKSKRTKKIKCCFWGIKRIPRYEIERRSVIRKIMMRTHIYDS